jgi:prepilin-type N-terminal cleavage/methylation domain-containing protein
MKKSGFTLIELMVYIAIVGVVVIVAGQAFSNSTKMRVRTESMIKANAAAEAAGMLIQEDISQMGAKSAQEEGTSFDIYEKDQFYVSDSVYMDIHGDDFSSFSRVQKNKNDEFTMREMRFDENGHFVSVEEVVWFVNNQKLYRKCRLLDAKTNGSSECPKEGNTVEVMDNVMEFKVVPAKPAVLAGTSSKIFPSTEASAREFRLIPRNQDDFALLTREPERGGPQVVLSNFASNYDKDNQTVLETKKANQLYAAAGTDDTPINETSWSTSCSRITLEARTEYELSFEVVYNNSTKEKKSRSFCPGVDHMAVGFRDPKDGSAVSDMSDFVFYPSYETADDKRSFRIKTESTKADVCIAFTFSMFSPTVSEGSITIANLSLSKVEDSEYDFEESYYPTNVEDKQKIKAFKLSLTINQNGESGVVSAIVPTPSNGKAK